MTTECIASSKFYLMSWHKVTLHQPFSVNRILRSSLVPYVMLYEVKVINVTTSDPEYRLHEQVRNTMARDPASPDPEYRQLDQARYLVSCQVHG
jgi:hypothetical protein